MRRRFVLIALVSASLAACSTAGTAPQPKPSALDDFRRFHSSGKIELVEEGGIAALSVNRVARYEDRSFLYTLRHLCSVNCGAALDSAGGALAQAAADSLFNTMFLANPFALEDDYGTTLGAADMMTYTLRVTYGSDTTKTIRADDGTMPPPMRRIVEAVHATISAAHR